MDTGWRQDTLAAQEFAAQAAQARAAAALVPPLNVGLAHLEGWSAFSA